MNKKKLVIYGLGETADIAFEYFTHDSEYEVVAFTVDNKFLIKSVHHGLNVVEFENLEEHYPPSHYHIFAASSYTKLNRVRTKMFKAAKSKGYTCATYISSKAFVWHNVTIGENVMIFEGNVVQHMVKIGDNVVLWSGNFIGHQTILEDNIYLSAQCVVSGFCVIGESSFLGANCTFNDFIRLGKDNIVGSGALVVKDTEDGKLMIGVPAKPSSKSSYETFDVSNEWI